MTHYEILGIPVDADFKAVKKAYYRRAKECHPDLHANSKAREEEFKLVAEAFNCLSDPVKRPLYDRSLLAPAADSQTAAQLESPLPDSIMDSPADDDLEELITGNNVPMNTNLSTLFLDLTRTEVFVDFREGKTLFFQQRYRAARNFFNKIVDHSPGNIVYRYYLARTCAMLGDYRRARSELEHALELGRMRTPPQQLRRIRRELDRLNQEHRPWWQLLFNIVPVSHHQLAEDAAEEMIDETNRAIAHITEARRKKELQPPPRKLLDK